MAHRHLSRSLALQSLFEWDFNDRGQNSLDEVLGRISEDFAPGLPDISFAKKITNEVVKHVDKLDAIIEKAAPDWPISQIAIVDRNVLRIGLYELLFEDKNEVPARVAINESIELAKTFGGEKSGRFVNGVLGAVYKEMGEPGKDDVPKKKSRPKDVPYEQMPIEQLAGAIVFSFVSGGLKLAFVHDVFGHWTLSKGHVEEGESIKEATIREMKEEMSVDVKIMEKVDTNEYIASDPEKGKIRKQVVYFLAEANNPENLKLGEDKGGLDDVKWFSLEEVPDLNMYDDIVPIVTKGIQLLSKKEVK